MIIPEKMCRVTIIGLKDNMNKIINYLYANSVMHLEKVKVEGKSISLADDELRYLDLDSKINSLFSNLEKVIEIKEPKTFKRINDKELKKGEKLIERFANLFRELDEMEKEMSCLKEDYEIINLLVRMGISDLGYMKDIVKHLIVVGTISKDKTSKFIDTLTYLKKKENIEVYLKRGRNRDYALVITLKDNPYIGEIFSLMDTHYILEEVYKRFKTKQRNVQALFKEISNKISRIEEKYKRTLSEICMLYNSNKELLWNMRYDLANKVNKIRGYDKFKEREYVYIIKGYIPSNRTKSIINGIKKIDPNVMIEIEEIDEGDAPVSLKYPKILKGIHFLLEAYGLPAYGYIDPSIIMLFTFPLFYGFILGDIGYGLSLLIASLLLRRVIKSQGIKLLSNVLILSSISSIIFGIIFGEFFGAEEIFGYKMHPLLHRMHEINELIIISIVIGVLHINMGLILGVIQDIIHKKYLHALTHRISWMLLQCGVACLGYGYYSNISLYVLMGYFLLIFGIGMIYYAEKLKGIFELPSIFTNILSYVRLGAVGLSSVSIAYVINLFVEMFFEKHALWGYLIGMLIFLIGHVFNLILGVIGPFLHSLRLHYVEFFTKFYKSGGEKYTPYGWIKYLNTK